MTKLLFGSTSATALPGKEHTCHSLTVTSFSHTQGGNSSQEVSKSCIVVSQHMLHATAWRREVYKCPTKAHASCHLPGSPGKPSCPGAPGSPGRPSSPGRPASPGSPFRPLSPLGPDRPGSPGKPPSPLAPGSPGHDTQVESAILIPFINIVNTNTSPDTQCQHNL